ncbi:YccT family protein [Photobacterium swingsii]|uniref:YccT family protein n=1 Tax=Photobacterium swingsii TaxID=680026 RepID=UPI004068C696
MNKTVVGFALSLVFAASAQANTLETEYGLSVLAINGVAVNSDNAIADNTYDIVEGKNQVVIRGEKMLRRGTKTELFSTRPFIMSFDTKDDVMIRFPEAASNYRAAETEFRNDEPKWSVMVGGTALPYQAEVLPGGGGFIPYSDIEELVANYNQDKGIALEQGKPTDMTKAAVVVNDAGEVTITGDSLAQLKLWYTKASAKEKKAFKIWMAEQEFK